LQRKKSPDLSQTDRHVGRLLRGGRAVVVDVVVYLLTHDDVTHAAGVRTRVLGQGVPTDALADVLVVAAVLQDRVVAVGVADHLADAAGHGAKVNGDILVTDVFAFLQG